MSSVVEPDILPKLAECAGKFTRKLAKAKTGSGARSSSGQATMMATANNGCLSYNHLFAVDYWVFQQLATTRDKIHLYHQLEHLCQLLLYGIFDLMPLTYP